ncbi:hypothetical protein HRI_004869800 [Hibiscus trionum]|uniref:VQ domain-containing protein n=1 Tax=Hibiscus trionum TaxID=183268 RepID=A0A9W7JAY2_HIBTR|nr:hypothetical protein HRI_004869800 [Hibiscus trionum]
MGSESREINNSIGGGKLQGPRPSALRVGGNASSTAMIKKSSHSNRNRISKVIKPVVIYLRSPKIIHVRPEEFMSIVQRLTGKDSTNESRNKPASASPAEYDEPITLFDADDQVLGMSPTPLHFLACVQK